MREQGRDQDEEANDASGRIPGRGGRSQRSSIRTAFIAACASDRLPAVSRLVGSSTPRRSDAAAAALRASAPIDPAVVSGCRRWRNWQDPLRRSELRRPPPRAVSNLDIRPSSRGSRPRSSVTQRAGVSPGFRAVRPEPNWWRSSAKGSRHVPRETALDHVFGWSILSDVSMLLTISSKAPQWTMGKNFDGTGFRAAGRHRRRTAGQRARSPR